MELQLQTVSTVSKNLGISTRMLRYYEQIGLIESKRKENYSYRVYDETAVKRLRQIILLRKLRIPMKQIKYILEKQEITETIVKVFQENINELNKEIADLSAIKDILNGFIKMLEEKIDIELTFDLLNDESVSNVIASLNLPKNYIKEEKSMKEMEDIHTLARETYKTIEMQFGYSLIPLVDENQGSDVPERVRNLKQKIAMDMGVVIDYIYFCDNMKIKPNAYVIKVKGRELATGEIYPDIIDPQSVIITHLTEIIKTHAKEF
jgi:flagellar biosynthesis component FlhA